MSIDDIRKKLTSVDELPALPTIIAEINELLNSVKTTAPQLSAVIMRDPTITAKVLKIVNSAFFGFPKPITSVNQAIIALGFNTVRSIVLCSSVMEAFGHTARYSLFSRKNFWKFCVGCAAASRVVARNAGDQKLDTAFVAGLLNGIGRIVMDEYFNAEFSTVFKVAKDGNRPLWEVEREMLGYSDCEVGGVMLSIWKLSPELIVAVAFQERPYDAPEQFRQLSAYVAVANIIARVINLGDPGDVPVPTLDARTLELAGVQEVQWNRLLELTIDEAKKAAVFFDS